MPTVGSLFDEIEVGVMPRMPMIMLFLPTGVSVISSEGAGGLSDSTSRIWFLARSGAVIGATAGGTSCRLSSRRVAVMVTVSTASLALAAFWARLAPGAASVASTLAVIRERRKCGF